MVRYVVSFMLMCFVAAGCAQLSPDTGATPSGRAVDDLAATVRQRLASDPITLRINFGIEADDGVVTLRGRVESANERLRAISIVRSTPGVRAVIDKTQKF